MRIAACGSDVDGLCRCHEHCRAARDRISARSDRDRGTLCHALRPPLLHQAHLPSFRVRDGPPAGPERASTSSTRLNERKTQEEHVDDGESLATPLSKCIHPCKALLCFLCHPAHGWMFRTQGLSGRVRRTAHHRVTSTMTPCSRKRCLINVDIASIASSP